MACWTLGDGNEVAHCESLARQVSNLYLAAGFDDNALVKFTNGRIAVRENATATQFPSA
jgi:hypothetical protein